MIEITQPYNVNELIGKPIKNSTYLTTSNKTERSNRSDETRIKTENSMTKKINKIKWLIDRFLKILASIGIYLIFLYVFLDPVGSLVSTLWVVGCCKLLWVTLF